MGRHRLRIISNTAYPQTSEEVLARIEAGEIPWQIAQSQGLSEDQIRQLMNNTHEEAMDQVLEAGLLTQERAD